jgi:hypothetical protein
MSGFGCQAQIGFGCSAGGPLAKKTAGLIDEETLKKANND